MIDKMKKEAALEMAKKKKPMGLKKLLAKRAGVEEKGGKEDMDESAMQSIGQPLISLTIAVNHKKEKKS